MGELEIVTVCDWCGQESDTLIPEEGDEWICQDCLEKDIKENGHIGGNDE